MSEVGRPTLRESPLYERLSGGAVRCLVCERRCVLRPGQVGLCQTRLNREGALYTRVYGALSALESRPIEIKPFYHFWPGSSATTISTWGCNFRCPWCQNWHLSQVDPPENPRYVPPEDVVKTAFALGDEGVCVSFNEPTMLFEYSLDLFRLARERGLYCTYVSNGYMTSEALERLVEAGLNGLKIDIKGGERAYAVYAPGADWRVPWRNADLAVEMGVHVELVYLVIPGVNDRVEDLRAAARLAARLRDGDTPIHFTRYFPAHRHSAPPTPVSKLELACEVAREEGVRFAYVGNVPGHRLESTYCPDCGELLIRRFGPRVLEVRLRDGRCPGCGSAVPIVGSVRVSRR